MSRQGGFRRRLDSQSSKKLSIDASGCAWKTHLRPELGKGEVREAVVRQRVAVAPGPGIVPLDVVAVSVGFEGWACGGSCMEGDGWMGGLIHEHVLVLGPHRQSLPEAPPVQPAPVLGGQRDVVPLRPRPEILQVPS